MIGESEASPQIRALYSEIKQALGIPYVATVYQAFATYPAFLELHWQAMRPVVGTQEFFRLADRLRADAFTRVHNYFTLDPCDGSASQQDAPAAAVEMLYYANPLLLLLIAAQLEAFEYDLGEARTVHPAAPPVVFEAPSPIEENSASPKLRRLYAEIRRTLGLPYLPIDYLLLGRWPAFLENHWHSLAPVLASTVGESSQHSLRETAFSLAREFPCRIQAGIEQMNERLAGREIQAVAQLTERFVNCLSYSVLEATIAKICIEGGTAGRKPLKPGERRSAA